MKKLVSLLLSVAIIATMATTFGVSVSAAAADDTPWTVYAQEIIPNEDGVYEIQTAEQLAWVAKMTNEAPADAETGMPWSLKKRFSLMNSIDISAHQWIPIGTFKGEFNRIANMFYGVFDGNGNTIRGLTIQGDLTNENFQTIGLFGAAASFTRTESETNQKVFQNYISDLFLKYVKIDVASPIASNVTYVGSVVGCGQLNLYNCSASGTIKTKNVQTTGGVSGMQNESMTKCVSNVEINAAFDVLQAWSYVGGVAGDFVQANVTACISNGDIVASNITNCGGISGQTQDVIQTSFSTSKITVTSTGTKNVGNIVGSVLGAGGGKVLGCFMANDVNPEMGGCGNLKDTPTVEIAENTLEYMKTKEFINDLITASESATPSLHLAEKFMATFQTDIAQYTMVNGLPSSVQPTEYDTQITAKATIPVPTYTVTIPSTIDFGGQKQALAKYRDESTDQYGNAVTVSQAITLSATGVANLFNDLADGKNDHIDVTVAHAGKLVGTNGAQNEVPFVLKQGAAELETGAKIATFYNDVDLGHDGKPAANTATAEITINRTNITNADSYSGTLTFTIAVADR